MRALKSKWATRLAGATLAAGLAFSAAPASAALIGYYDFENSDATDTSGQANHGIVGFTTLGQGVGGGIGGDFSVAAGTANIITLPFDIRAANFPTLTMGAFVRSGIGNGNASKVLSHDNGGFDRTLGRDTRSGTSGGYAGFTGGGVLNSSTTLTAGGAYDFIAIRYTGANTIMTVNGVHTTGADASAGNVGFTSLYVGGNPGFNEDWVGQIDNVFIFDKALTDQELSTIQQNGGISTNEVPVPAAGLLMAGVMALFGAGALRRW